MTPPPTRPTPPHLVTGTRGEDLATRYLEQQGLVVLSKNWRCREGELDLVATDRRKLIVCEVKTRTSTNYGHPAEAVTGEKANRIRRLSRQWRAAHEVGWCEERFDIIAITWPPDGEPTLQHFKAAF
ncbi:YraN family protein [Actinophytocola sediminis]